MRRLGLLAIATALLLAGVVAPAQASHRVPIGGGQMTPAQAQRVANYWTPARMRSALPASALAGHLSARSDQPPRATISSRPVAETILPPYNTAGRIFARIGQYNFWCSGVAVNTPGRRLVLTAGHCLWNLLPRHRRPSAARDLQFAPAYSKGQAPYGSFVMEEGFVLGQWKNRFNPNYDMGAIVTYPNALGQGIADAVGGGATLAINKSKDQVFQVLGYPGANQQRMQECDGVFAGNSPVSRYYSGPAQLTATCFLLPGASGGPWFAGEPPQLYGLSSEDLTLQAHDHYITSPYFSSATVGALTKGL